MTHITEAQQVEINDLIARSTGRVTRRPTVGAIEEILYRAHPVLDHGFIRLMDYMGDDEAIVQAARVSYGRVRSQGLRTFETRVGRSQIATMAQELKMKRLQDMTPAEREALPEVPYDERCWPNLRDPLEPNDPAVWMDSKGNYWGFQVWRGQWAKVPISIGPRNR